MYIIECSDQSYYTGFCDDIELRVKQHEEGVYPQNYTFKRRPIKLVYFEIFTNIQLALSYEKQIKGWTKAKKKALIETNIEKLKELTICKNSTSSKRFYT